MASSSSDTEILDSILEEGKKKKKNQNREMYSSNCTEIKQGLPDHQKREEKFAQKMTDLPVTKLCALKKFVTIISSSFLEQGKYHF